MRFGLPARAARERQRLRMIVDALLAQPDALALGLIDGRYESVETAIEVLMSIGMPLVQGAAAT